MSICDRCKNKCKFMLKNKTLDACGLFEKQTNFDRITASPEVLAEFIENILDACSGDIDECDVCQLGKHCNPCDGFKKIALNWLNEESKE